MVRITASAEIDADRDAATRLIADPTIVEKWLPNKHGVKADATWPHFGTHLSWEIGADGENVCDATVLDNALPDFLRVQVSTPTSNKTIIHKFESLGNGRTRYEKVVEAELKGVNKFLGAIGVKRLTREIEREVADAARAVPTAASKPARKAKK